MTWTSESAWNAKTVRKFLKKVSAAWILGAANTERLIRAYRTLGTVAPQLTTIQDSDFVTL